MIGYGCVYFRDANQLNKRDIKKFIKYDIQQYQRLRRALVMIVITIGTHNSDSGKCNIR